VWLPLAHPGILARSDQATLAGFLAAVPGGGRAAAAIAGTLLGVAGAAVALRLWGPLVALTGTLVVGWLVVGAPAVASRNAARTSLRELALTTRERFPPGAPLAFFGEPVRSIVVYVGRPIPSLRRRPERIVPGLGVLATDAAYTALAGDGHLGAVLASGSGTVGNLERGTVVLAEGR